MSHYHGRKAKVHLNLQKGPAFGLFSVKIGTDPPFNVPHVYLKNVIFRVVEGGRQRVIKHPKHHKNVHAWAEGTFSDQPCVQQNIPLRTVTYDPLKYPNFYEPGVRPQPVYTAKGATLTNKLVYIDHEN